MPASWPDLTGRRILVTGATGFVGSAFARGAVAAGADVTVIARPASDLWRLAEAEGHYRRVTCTLDGLAAEAPADADVFVHLAAAGVDQTFDDVEEMVRTNVTGTLQALRYAQRAGVERFVLAGSSGEYGPGEAIGEDAPLRPSSEYGATRAAATLLARSFGSRRGLDVVAVRPFSVYGPYEAAYRLIPYAIVTGLRGRTIEISSGVQHRDFVHVADVARGIALAAVVPGVAGETFNLCTGVATSVREVAELAGRLTGRGSNVSSGVRAPIPGEMWRTSGSPAAASSRLGWRPEWSLDDGVADTVRWFRQVGMSLRHYAASD